VTNSNKDHLRQIFSALDPVELLSQIRLGQRNLAALETGGNSKTASETTEDLNRFVQSLSVIWRDGEVRPTHRKQFSGPRAWRTRIDPFENVWPVVEQWLNEQPDVTAKDLFHRLQAQTPYSFDPSQLRTLQRRVKQWRTEIARQLVLGSSGYESAACVHGRAEDIAQQQQPIAEH